MKKHHLYSILLRALFLLIISFVVTSWLFSNIQRATQSKNVFDEKYEISYTPVPLTSFLKDISPTFHIPLSFLRFDVYAYNNVTAKTNDGQATSTFLNINILQLYTGKIKTDQTEIVRKNISSYNLSGLNYTRSFDTADIATTTLRGDYTVFLKPTQLTFITTWAIIIVPIVYAFIVIFSACFKFVLLGSPFMDVVKGFKKELTKKGK